MQSRKSREVRKTCTGASKQVTREDNSCTVHVIYYNIRTAQLYAIMIRFAFQHSVVLYYIRLSITRAMTFSEGDYIVLSIYRVNNPDPVSKFKEDDVSTMHPTCMTNA